MLRGILLSYLAITAFAYDPTTAHGGIFRPLILTNPELALVSRLHATASYHELFDFIKEKLLTTPVTHEERKKIEKFLLQNRPPGAIKHFLDEADRNYIAVLHAAGNIPESYGVVEKAILRLPENERRAVVKYIWKDPEPFMFQHFGLDA